MSNNTDTPPIKPIAEDGIYPRCVYCGTEIYGPIVIDYSKGKVTPGCCGRALPGEYVKL